MAKLLIVDDNPMNVDMLARRLKRRGHDILTAENGAVGVSVAEKALPDLVLMDLSMPTMNGWDATRRLREIPATAKTPVIAVTSHAMTGDEAKAREAGCSGFVSKPINFEQLFQLIDQLIGGQTP